MNSHLCHRTHHTLAIFILHFPKVVTLIFASLNMIRCSDPQVWEETPPWRENVVLTPAVLNKCINVGLDGTMTYFCFHVGLLIYKCYFLKFSYFSFISYPSYQFFCHFHTFELISMQRIISSIMTRNLQYYTDTLGINLRILFVYHFDSKFGDMIITHGYGTTCWSSYDIPADSHSLNIAYFDPLYWRRPHIRTGYSSIAQIAGLGQRFIMGWVCPVGDY